MVTIKDVAKEAGVGVGTVSRYINGDDSIKIKNRILINDAIKKLGYEVNSIARSMKTQKTMTIGVIVHSLTNMFSMKVIENIEQSVAKIGYSIIVAGCSGNEKVQQEKIIDMKKRMIDGLVIMPVAKNSQKIKKIVGDIPCVLVDRTFDENIFDSVTVDNEILVYEKMCEVIKLGFKKIGIIEGPESISNAVERKNGFYKALKKNNIECSLSISANYEISDGFEAMTKILEKGIETVFISNYEQLVGALKALNGSDKNIYIVGFDGIELPWLLNIPYTFIEQPIEKIGKRAAELLLERISNPDMDIKNIVIR